MNWSHFWSDLTIGQVLAFCSGVVGLLTLWFSGRAVRVGRASLRAIRGLIASVGHPEHEDHREGLTLTAKVDQLGQELSWFREKYKRDFDNMRSQQLLNMTGRRNDEPPVRDRDEDVAETWRNGH